MKEGTDDICKGERSEITHIDGRVVHGSTRRGNELYRWRTVAIRARRTGKQADDEAELDDEEG
jgi:hypothetical protein